ncbi:hypothetical protein DFR35_0973 [Sulfurisoma sediminicola]|uniref:Tetratricopeptide repeat protein n=1 Tax=Sulfurisoma sediminicola TaxID=1381557 RepID=A0A497XKC3_9PROT|nr:hypothetical protein DFR35_0973 [Sulfurisoma sediminicola]
MKKSVLATVLGAIVSAGAAQAAPADEVKALLEQKSAVEAYSLGRANPGEMGNPTFDFFYGIAAIDAGHAGEGVLALERYLLSFPENRSARFQLARGYYVLGEDQRARDEFQTLLADASGDERTATERFLDAIKAREGRYSPTGSAFVELGFGYDTNLNFGIAAGSSPSIPGFGPLPPLAPTSVTAKAEDGFTAFAAGAQGAYPVAPGTALYGAVGLDARMYFKENYNQFDQLNVGASGGVSHIADLNLYKVGVGYAQNYVDQQAYVNTVSLNGEWHHQYDQFNRFILGAQVAALSFSDMDVYLRLDKVGGKVRSLNSRFRDSTFAGVVGSWVRSFNTEYLPVLTVTGNYGEENNVDNRPDLSRNIYGLRAGVSLTPAPKWGATIGANYQQNDYMDKFGLLPGADPRRDMNLTVDGSVSYFYSKELTLRGELLATKQDSNIGLYDYDRYVVGVKARYDFK